jgi:hypothetical protein
VEAMYSAYVVLVSVAPSAVPVLLYRISSVRFKNRPQKHRGGRAGHTAVHFAPDCSVL